ncbi:serine hydrolase domain-containing protein [Phenylobacterium sp.]|uniref:serine hydrolase domain-containing protein n=1 Tax=Phenylobacterium sp. TaxID=1871053 RepID=UPI00391D2DDC
MRTPALPRRAALLAAAALPFAGAAAAQSARPDGGRIDRVLAGFVADGRVAGASALIWQDGRERYFGAHGFADREAGRGMARGTLAHIYSMTKPVTGVALMQLWEQGRFGLDDPLALHLPEFADVQVLEKGQTGALVRRPPARPITVRDILRHTAGFSYGSGDAPADAAWRADDPFMASANLTEFSRRVAALPLVFDPGAEWRYSAAVDIQSALIERLSGMAFETYVARNVFQPLGMAKTGWRAAEGATPATIYSPGPGGGLVPQPRPVFRFASGGAGLISTLDDYMRFARMLLGEGSLDGTRILKPSTVRLMATDHLDPRITERLFLPSKGSVGFGIDFAVRTAQPRSPDENRGAVGEFFWDGYATTLFWVDPANRLAAVFFVQKTPFDGTLHRDFRAAVYGPDYLGPKGD